MRGIVWCLLGPGSSLCFLLTSCCLPLEARKRFFEPGRTGLELCSVTVPSQGKLYYFFKPQFPGGLRGSRSGAHKKYNLLSHCEARCWETNSNQSHPFTLETLDLTHEEEGSGHQHGKIERGRHGRSVSSGEPNWTDE